MVRDMAHAEIPTDTQDDDFGLEMTPFERILPDHDVSSFALFSRL